MSLAKLHLLSTHKLTLISALISLSFSAFNIAQTSDALDSANQQVDSTFELSSNENAIAPGNVAIDELQAFVNAFVQIRATYVEEVDDKTLLENAIRGMLLELDPHSNYLEPETFEDLQVSASGEFGGLGIEVGMEDGFVKVISPIDDTPAQKAGIESGDLIVKIDNKPVKGMTLNEAVGMMRGKVGTPITCLLYTSDAADD